MYDDRKHESEQDWQDQANCLGVDPDLFFPERGASTREAKEVCRGCVVRLDCLEYALANGEKFGIWGGLSERERRRLRRQRDLAYELITAIPGVSCVKPSAALYMFPRLDPAMYPIQDDQQFINELLQETKVLLVQGSGFNWPSPDHFRIVFLPHEDDLREAIARIARFLDNYRKRHAQ